MIDQLLPVVQHDCELVFLVELAETVCTLHPNSSLSLLSPILRLPAGAGAGAVGVGDVVAAVAVAAVPNAPSLFPQDLSSLPCWKERTALLRLSVPRIQDNCKKQNEGVAYSCKAKPYQQQRFPMAHQLRNTVEQEIGPREHRSLLPTAVRDIVEQRRRVLVLDSVAADESYRLPLDRTGRLDSLLAAVSVEVTKTLEETIATGSPAAKKCLEKTCLCIHSPRRRVPMLFPVLVAVPWHHPVLWTECLLA